MNTISQERWNALSDKAKWDTISALRGPDCPRSEGIKWFGTSVIRGALSGIMRVGGLVNKDLSLVIIPTGSLKFGKYEGAIQARWDYTHYFCHVAEAAAHLGIPIMHLPGSVYEKHFCCSYPHPQGIGDGILAWIKEVGEESLFPTPAREHVKELERHLAALKGGIVHASY